MPTAPRRDDLARAPDAAHGHVRSGKLREGHDPRRNGHLLALPPRGEALAVPPLERFVERTLDARSEPQPHGESNRHLAAAAQSDRQRRGCAREEGRDRAHAFAQPLTAREAACEARNDVARAARVSHGNGGAKLDLVTAIRVSS